MSEETGFIDSNNREIAGIDMDEKIENQLNLSLSLTPEEREKSRDLDVGYDRQQNLWELIIRYIGEISQIPVPEGGRLEALSNEYAIAYLPEESIDAFSNLPQVIYMEKPKNLLLSDQAGIAASCILSVRDGQKGLHGDGTYVAVIDTGIDIFHPDFIDDQGNTVIETLWDQTIPGHPPEGFYEGSVYTKEEINRALKAPAAEGREIVPSRDTNGHGTHVASICAGRQGVADKSSLIVVKLGNATEQGFPRTTQLMTALEYVIRYAEAKGKPVSVNLSYGNNYGDHRGNSLLETYISQMAGQWQTTVCIGTGNEGASGRHRQGCLRQPEDVIFAVAPYEQSLNLQLWKNYVDEFRLWLQSPSGERREIQDQEGRTDYRFGTTTVYVYYGSPTPYNRLQEIYFAFVPQGSEIESGQWTIVMEPGRIVRGDYYMWLPVSAGTNEGTRFLEPSLDLTLTIPSTARSVISVGAYDVFYNSYASFSGRGDLNICMEKPDIVAPGVGILGASPGGGNTRMSGTSMATPFVTGSAALLMEWGIVRGNDPFLYGEKIKAYLQKGARELPGFSEYSNSQVGYGKLCVRDSLPI